MSWRRGDDSTVTTLPEPEVGRDVPPLPPPAPPPRMAPWRKVAVGAVLAALIGGLVWQYAGDGGDGGDEVATPTSVTTATTAAPVTVPVDPSKPPELRNTGDDFDTIVRSVRDFENWVYQFDPDPKWVPMYLDPRNEDEFGFELAKEAMTALKTNGYHYDGPRSKVLKVMVSDRVSDHQVGVYVVYEGMPANVVDSDGKVQFPQETTGPTGYLQEWVRGEDGRWLIAHTAYLGPPAPEVLR